MFHRVFGVSQPHRSLDLWNLWTGSQWQLGLSYLQEIQRDLQPSVVSISAAMSACEGGGKVVLVNQPENMGFIG